MKDLPEHRIVDHPPVLHVTRTVPFEADLKAIYASGYALCNECERTLDEHALGPRFIDEEGNEIQGTRY